MSLLLTAPPDCVKVPLPEVPTTIRVAVTAPLTRLYVPVPPSDEPIVSVCASAWVPPVWVNVPAPLPPTNVWKVSNLPAERLYVPLPRLRPSSSREVEP